MELKIGTVVRTLSGHDKYLFQVIIDIIETKYKNKFVLLCDGKSHKLEKPKKKNSIHIALTNTVLEENLLKTDKSIRNALKPFYEKNV
ncbi:MAG: KOW domain-containing RNA-binding protein [Clostridia bacterium]|nr:KOW domain-containing RNA-binding protein [Clostridia bacterium]